MDFAAELIEQNRLLCDLVRSADTEVIVPTCPEWTLRQLVTHVGRGDRWAAVITGDRAQGAVAFRDVPGGAAPKDWAAAVDWLAETPRLIIDAVDAAGPDTSVWTFVGPKPAAWWIRRRLHETVIHRADAAIAVGEPFAVDPNIAADCLSEWLGMVANRPDGGRLLPAGATLHVHATDDNLTAPGEWMIGADGAKLTWEHAHAKGTAAIRGHAADLLLTLLRRRPLDARTDVVGDPAVVDHWITNATF